VPAADPVNADVVTDQFPLPSATAVPTDVAPSNTATVAPASAPDPVNVGVVTLVMLSVLDEPESDPAVRSGADGAAVDVLIVTERPPLAALTFPAVSVAVAVIVCDPAVSVDVAIE